MSYQQVRRRLIDTSPWKLEELRAIAAAFGESLQSLLADEGSACLDPAWLAVAGLRIPCSVSVGSVVRRARRGRLVVTRTPNGRLHVIAATGSEVASFEVRKLVVDEPPAPRFRIAISDDDRASANFMAQQMSEAGLDATAFSSVDDMVGASAVCFDGYVVECLTNAQDLRSLVAQIRARSAHCAIVILTRHLASGLVPEAGLTAMAADYRCQFFEKPTRTSAIIAALELEFERSGED